MDAAFKNKEHLIPKNEIVFLVNNLNISIFCYVETDHVLLPYSKF
jgi:hypothetical protein